jgi:hypothetical protein
MKGMEINRMKDCSLGSKMWMALGGLIVVGMTIMFLRETPAVRRELRILRM